ncbi:uncharacterized protein LOC127001071 [Eriocheir sinensis]|uniref:uncharacterized protein LOC127001071 n=1 Tax=Eriocheir sinensis TaxID=95602 RepID=UPI0021C637F0|nr:uncharacterized protein LOC127001071 [Eriocheir sinensis]
MEVVEVVEVEVMDMLDGNGLVTFDSPNRNLSPHTCPHVPIPRCTSEGPHLCLPVNRCVVASRSGSSARLFVLFGFTLGGFARRWAVDARTGSDGPRRARSLLQTPTDPAPAPPAARNARYSAAQTTQRLCRLHRREPPRLAQKTAQRRCLGVFQEVLPRSWAITCRGRRQPPPPSLPDTRGTAPRGGPRNPRRVRARGDSTDEEADHETYGTKIYEFMTNTRRRRGTELWRKGMARLLCGHGLLSTLNPTNCDVPKL